MANMFRDFGGDRNAVDRMRIHEGEIGLTRMTGRKLKLLDGQSQYLVFWHSGELLYAGHNPIVAALVAVSFDVSVY